MSNGISFQGRINLTTYTMGEKKVAQFITSVENDNTIRETARECLGYFNPNNFKILKEEQDNIFRRAISKIIGTDITKKNYLETSIVSYSPGNIVVKDLNRRTHDGIELDIILH